jgi:hypothetical protein
MLGHANIEQTSTYLNVTLQVIRSLTKALDRTRGRATNRASPAPLATPLQTNRPATLAPIATVPRLPSLNCW